MRTACCLQDFPGVGQNAVAGGFPVHRGTMKELPFNQLIQNIRSKRAPFTVVFEITNKCNLKCLHCYQGHTREELTLLEVQRILGGLAECGCLKLTLSGGEPTLREDFLDIFEYCHKLGFAITLFTNATRLTSKIRAALLEMTPYAVECSLYGASAEVHDDVTLRQGSFDSSLANIQWMVANGIRVVVKSVVLSSNIRELGDLQELTRKLGVPFQYTPRIFPSLDVARPIDSLRVGTEELRKNLKKAKTECDDRPDRDENLAKEFLCNAGRESCSISAEGKVYPCVALRWECGDLRKQSFSQIWKQSEVLNKIRSCREEDFLECFRCPQKLRCNFCPGMGFFEHGDMLRPSRELCRLTGALHG